MAKGKSTSAKWYAEHPKAAQEKSDDNNSGKNGKYAHTNEYKRRHNRDRKRLLKIGKLKPHQHVVYKNGKPTAGNAYKNSADGARKGASRRA